MEKSEMLKMALEASKKTSARIYVEKKYDDEAMNVEMQGTLVSLIALSAAVISGITKQISEGSQHIPVLMAYRNMVNNIFDKAVASAFSAEGSDGKPDEKHENTSESMDDPQNIENLLTAMFGGARE